VFDRLKILPGGKGESEAVEGRRLGAAMEWKHYPASPPSALRAATSPLRGGLKRRRLPAITRRMTYTPVTPADMLPATTRFVRHDGAAFLIVCDTDGSIYALDGLCSHAQFPLEGARLRRGHIICPHHGARFDITTGAAKGPPASCGIARYAAREADGMIELDVGA